MPPNYEAAVLIPSNDSKGGSDYKASTEAHVYSEEKFTVDTAAMNESFRIVNKYLQEKLISAPAAFPAACLHMYNFIHENPLASEQSRIQELKKLDYLIQDEVRLSLDPHVPSVGVEVEVSNSVFSLQDNPSMSAYLQELGLDVHQRGLSNATEFGFPPSNSPVVQSRMISELRRAGLIPSDMRRFASLHINLGLPLSVGVFDKVQQKSAKMQEQVQQITEVVSDLLTFAFVPSSRIRSRQFSSMSYSLDKHGDSVILKSVKDSSVISRNTKVFRIEFRTLRIVNAKTYRLIREAQDLGRLILNNDPRSAALRSQLTHDVDALRGEYGLEADEPRNNQEHVADIIKEAEILKREFPNESNLVIKARKLMTKYGKLSREIGPIPQNEPSLIEGEFSSFRRFGRSILKFVNAKQKNYGRETLAS